MFFLGTCADPTPINGQISPLPTIGRFTMDTVVRLTCHSGYIQHGPINNTCLDGRWLGGKTTCEGN